MLNPSDTILDAITSMAQFSESGEEFDDSFAILEAALTLASDSGVKRAMDALYIGKLGRRNKEIDFMEAAKYTREIDRRMRY